MNGPESFVHPVNGKRVRPFEWYDGFAHQTHELEISEPQDDELHVDEDENEADDELRDEDDDLNDESDDESDDSESDEIEQPKKPRRKRKNKEEQVGE